LNTLLLLKLKRTFGAIFQRGKSLFNKTSKKKPRLSLIVTLYSMPEQAKRTLYSLSAAYQEGVLASEYEIIVVENASDRPMGENVLKDLSGNFRYFYRHETLPTPVFAVNFGADKAEGELIGVMIDGARMATPGMIKNILQASRVSNNAVIGVPGYHLGDKVQQEAMNSGYNEEVEAGLLHSIGWPENGYRLFDIGCFSATSRPGFFQAIDEVNCLVIPRHIWSILGGIDQRFTGLGGGLANLDLYKRACEYKDTELITLPGEGTFHQFHGGATTGQKKEKRDKTMQDIFNQYIEIRGEKYARPRRRAKLYGHIPDNALPYMDHSVKVAMKVNK
jgi:glycosyltransferase involved in cell wall biosynthesis